MVDEKNGCCWSVCFERRCSAVICCSDVQEHAATTPVQVAQSYHCCACDPGPARLLSLLGMPRETRLETGERCFALCATPPSCFSELSNEVFFHEILKGLDLVKALLSVRLSASICNQAWHASGGEAFSLPLCSPLPPLRLPLCPKAAEAARLCWQVCQG